MHNPRRAVRRGLWGVAAVEWRSPIAPEVITSIARGKPAASSDPAPIHVEATTANMMSDCNSIHITYRQKSLEPIHHLRRLLGFGLKRPPDRADANLILGRQLRDRLALAVQLGNYLLLTSI